MKQDVNSPRFACALSREGDSPRALEDALGRLLAELGGASPDLVAAFATHHYGGALEELGPTLCERAGAGALLGCTAESVIGDGIELENRAGLVLWGAHLPDTDVRFFEVQSRVDGSGHPTFSALPPVDDPSRASVLLLADPFTFPMAPYLEELNERLPGLPAMGGMASGALGAGQSLLLAADGVRESGCTGVVVEGAVELSSVVSQGCRPVGTPWVVTSCEENRILGLGGRPALQVLMETWNELEPADQERLQSGPFLGLAVDPRQSEFSPEDFLVRGIVGLGKSDSSIAVTTLVRRGQTVQLLVRDEVAAGEELERMMRRHGGARPGEGDAAGALLFSCNGRGSRMFAEPGHDVRRVQGALEGSVPVAGFFAAGEIGPVAGKNFLHGFTASVAVYRRRAT